MPYKIFIDSKRKDQDLARDLSRRLERAGVQVLPLEGIEDDSDFKIRERSGLHQADELILLLTPNSINSKRFVFDMGVATSLEKPVTSIILGVEPKELSPIIKESTRINYADLESYISKLQKRATVMQRALDRMKEAMRSEKFMWRSIERLATVGGISESEALSVLQDDPDVVLGKGKSGEKLARLKKR